MVYLPDPWLRVGVALTFRIISQLVLGPGLPFHAGHDPTWSHGYSWRSRGIEGLAQIYENRKRAEGFWMHSFPINPTHPEAHPYYQARLRVLRLLPTFPCPAQSLESLVCKTGGAVCSGEGELVPTHLLRSLFRPSPRPPSRDSNQKRNLTSPDPRWETRMKAGPWAERGLCGGRGFCGGQGIALGAGIARGAGYQQGCAPSHRSGLPVSFPCADALGTFRL